MSKLRNCAKSASIVAIRKRQRDENAMQALANFGSSETDRFVRLIMDIIRCKCRGLANVQTSQQS